MQSHMDLVRPWSPELLEFTILLDPHHDGDYFVFFAALASKSTYIGGFRMHDKVNSTWRIETRILNQPPHEVSTGIKPVLDGSGTIFSVTLLLITIH